MSAKGEIVCSFQEIVLAAILGLKPQLMGKNNFLKRVNYFLLSRHGEQLLGLKQWHCGKTVQKISKITYTASRFPLLTSAKFSVNIKRVTIQHNEEFIVFFFFLFNGFIRMCNLKKRLIRAAF